VGQSGSGKSTITDLLLRLLDPDSGVIRIDGHDVRTVRLDDLRRHVACVDQEPCVLHASIADNLRYAKPEASDADLRTAAAQAALDGFIDGLPQGFDTIVGERGMALSAGERQRLATARAFLTSPAVLILDEPTAALDPIAERQIVNGYEAVMRDRTTIVITHRLDLAMRADRVVVLEGSRIVEEGTPADLYAATGRFAELFHTQSSG
jgi:ATP-binding cassette subfamily B protein